MPDITIARATAVGFELLTGLCQIAATSVNGGPVVPHEAFTELMNPQMIAHSLADLPDHRQRLLNAVLTNLNGSSVGFNATFYNGLKPDTVASMLNAALSAGIEPAVLRRAADELVIPSFMSKYVVTQFIAYGAWYKERGYREALLRAIDLVDRLQLITPSEKLTILGTDCLVDHLSENYLRELARSSISFGSENPPHPMDPKNVFGVVGNAWIVECLPGEKVWELVEAALVSQRLVFHENEEKAEGTKRGSTPPAAAPATEPPPAPPAAVPGPSDEMQEALDSVMKLNPEEPTESV